MTIGDTSAVGGELVLPHYPAAGVHPPLESPAYKSTLLRAPTQPLVPLPQRLTEITGPLLGAERVTAADADLTAGHPGEPLGERIIVTGRVLDSDGRPVPDTLIEIWQANASGRYAHERRRSSGPARPELHRRWPLRDRLARPLQVRHDQAGSLSVAQSPQRLAAGAHSLLAVRARLHPAPGHADVLSRPIRCSRWTRSSTRSPTRRRASG